MERTLLLVGFTVLVASGMVALNPVRRINPAYFFLPAQWLMGAGTIAVVDLSRPGDRLYVGLFFLSIIVFSGAAVVTAGALGLRSSYQRFWSRPVTSDSFAAKCAVGTLVVVAAVVTYVYYRQVGYNLFVELLVGGGITDVATARLAAYSGSEYLAPGYAAQFKNVILPLGLSVLVGWTWQAGRQRTAKVLIAVGIPGLLYALLGTGQRAFLVFAAIAFFFGLSGLMRLRATYLLPLGILVVVVFGVMSHYLGRITNLSTLAVAQEWLERLFVEEQQPGVVAFRYILEEGVVWFDNWIQGFAGILPGNPGAQLQAKVFAVLHGSERGTAAVATVASAYYNADIFGVIGLYGSMGIGYVWVFDRFLRGPRTVMRCFAYGALFFHMAIFVSGPPMTLVNRGVVTVLVLILVRKLALYRGTERTARSRAITVQQRMAD